MPSGLPSLGDINIPDSSLLVASIRTNAQYVVEYLEIPNYSLVKELFQIALQDTNAAARSSYAFLQTTSRPFIILLSLILKYVFICVKIIAEHTVYHAIRAMKEFWRQAQFAAKWLMAYQKSLSRSAIYMEIGFVFVLIGLYAIRKYIKRKKYVERVTRWYRGKRSSVLMKYTRFVDRIAQTSIVLALLLPHIFYVIIVTSMKWFLPSVVRYFACKTLLADLTSIYIPFVRTIVVVHKWRAFGFKTTANETVDQKNDDEDDANKVKSTPSETGRFMSMFRRKRVSSAYQKSLQTKKKGAKTKKPQITRTRLSDEQKKVVQEASQLLQYWVVYALISSVFQTLLLLPIASRILSNVNTKPRAASSLPWKQKKLTSWLNRITIKPSKEFLEEGKLLFFIWLRMLPTSFAGRNKGDSETDGEGKLLTGNTTVKNRVAAFEKAKSKVRKDSKAPFSNLPVDIIYDRLSPLVIAALSSSSRLLQNDGSIDANGPKSFLMRGVVMCRSFLDAMVWTKMISAKTKERIIVILVECSDLLPASVSFFMPSYFTNYGIIFVSFLVPSGKSAIACNSLKKTQTNTEIVKSMESTLRFLEYWIIQTIVYWIISAFTPVLAWVPLSTHLTLILWAYVQLEVVTTSWYNALEWDLVAFGLLNAHPHQKDAENVKVEDTTAMKVFNRIAKHVPSSLPSQDSIASGTSNGEEGVQKDESRNEEITTTDQSKKDKTINEVLQETVESKQDAIEPTEVDGGEPSLETNDGLETKRDNIADKKSKPSLETNSGLKIEKDFISEKESESSLSTHDEEAKNGGQITEFKTDAENIVQ